MAVSGGYGFKFGIGRIKDPVFGDITLMPAIAGYSADAIERRLGFHRGRLSEGYCVLVLTETVTIADFLWGDQTRYSGGEQLFRSEDAMVPRRDLLRGEMLVRYGNDTEADEALRNFFNKAAHRINEGVAQRTVIKVVANIPHNDDMPRHLQYPDADVRNIPQWKLIVGKAMDCVAQIPPGGTFSP